MKKSLIEVSAVLEHGFCLSGGVLQSEDLFPSTILKWKKEYPINNDYHNGGHDTLETI